jgi:hypothetical protein
MPTEVSDHTFWHCADPTIMPCSASQAQMKIKILEKVNHLSLFSCTKNQYSLQLPELHPPEQEETEKFR